MSGRTIELPTSPSPLMSVATSLRWMCTYFSTCFRCMCAYMSRCFNYVLEYLTLVCIYLRRGPILATRRYIRRVWEPTIDQEGDYMGLMGAEVILVIGSMIGAFNLQMPYNLPGGVYTDTQITNGIISHQAGKAIAGYKNPVEYRKLTIANTISLTCNLSIFILYAARLVFRKRIISFLLMSSLFWSITFVAYTYKIAMQITTPDHDQELQKEWDFVRIWINLCLGTWLVCAVVLLVVFISKVLKL